MVYTEYGNTWWGARWLDSLTQIDYSNRIPRGKRYARNRSVLSIKSSKGKVVARVQGKRATPYKIVVGISQYTKTDNKKLSDITIRLP
nr:hypothetical protein [uncultured Sphaerochaeta sp.]